MPAQSDETVVIFWKSAQLSRRWSVLMVPMKQFTLTLTLAAAALFAVPSTTFAQDKPAGDPPQRPEGARRMDPEARLKFLTEKLGLDADQQTKIKAIFEKNAPKFKELMTKGRENLTDADKTAMRDLMKAQTDEINAVLTPAQQEKMKEMRPPGRGGAKPAAPKAPAE
jgi:Spy/CpxP family protein refolding chaperone